MLACLGVRVQGKSEIAEASFYFFFAAVFFAVVLFGAVFLAAVCFAGDAVVAVFFAALAATAGGGIAGPVLRGNARCIPGGFCCDCAVMCSAISSV